MNAKFTEQDVLTAAAGIGLLAMDFENWGAGLEFCLMPARLVPLYSHDQWESHLNEMIAILKTPEAPLPIIEAIGCTDLI